MDGCRWREAPDDGFSMREESCAKAATSIALLIGGNLPVDGCQWPIGRVMGRECEMSRSDADKMRPKAATGQAFLFLRKVARSAGR